MSNRQQPEQAASGKGKLAPIEGGRDQLRRYYLSMRLLAACLLLPLCVAYSFQQAADLLLVPLIILCYAWPNVHLGRMVLYNPATSDADKAALWSGQARSKRLHALAGFIFVLLAYGLLMAFAPPAQPYPVWHDLLLYAGLLAFSAEFDLPDAIPDRHTVPPSTPKQVVMFMYALFLLLLIFNGELTWLGAALLLPFGVTLILHLRSRAASASPTRNSRIEAFYTMLDISFNYSVVHLIILLLFSIMANQGTLSSEAIFPGMAELPMPWWILLSLLLLAIMLSMLRTYAQRQRIRQGAYSMDIAPITDKTQPFGVQHRKWLLELKQQRPMLREPRHLAWIRLVTWLGPRAWLVGLLSSVAMMALVLG